MDYLDNQSRDYLVGRLKAAGFSLGEAETRAEALETENEVKCVLEYLDQHEGAALEEIRMFHTNILRKGESIKIETKKSRYKLADCNMVKDNLLIRQIKIDWTKVVNDSYIKNIRALEDLEELTFKKPVTFFVGENGSGKSTLLEAVAIACGFNPEGGTRNYTFSTNDTHSQLYEAIDIVKGPVHSDWGLFLRAESFYNVATQAEEYSRSSLSGNEQEMFARYNGRSFHKQSHGESFMSLLENDIQDRGLYFLDEPEAALSPNGQLKLLSLIHKYANRGAQFIIATHSPILLATPDATILEFTKRGIDPVSYEETEVYRIYSGIINARDDMMEIIY